MSHSNVAETKKFLLYLGIEVRKLGELHTPMQVF
jgi:hypothetical protein